MAGTRAVAGMRGLWLANFGDSENDFPGQPDAVAGLVLGHVVGDNAEERHQPFGTATRARAEEI